MRAGLLVIATTPAYAALANRMLKSADKYFLRGPNSQVTYFVFTDTDDIICNNALRWQCVITKIEHRPWPHVTLQRYSLFVQHAALFREMDYLFYCDADMLFVDHVGKEILHPLTVVIHPGHNGGRGTPETRVESTAYISDKEQVVYVCGGFNGGERERFLQMAVSIKENTDKDSAKGLIALWHDESHLNKYVVEFKKHQPQLVTYLSPSYCHEEIYTHLKKVHPRLRTVPKDNAILQK